jgi:hypothetical protein
MSARTDTRATGLALRDGGSFHHTPCGENVADLQRDQITAAQLAVDGHVEQRKIPQVAGHLEAHADGPHMLRQERSLLADCAALVPGEAGGADGRQQFGGHSSASSPPSPPFFNHVDAEGITRSRKMVCWWRIRAVPVAALTAGAEARCVGAAGARQMSAVPMLPCSDKTLPQ